MLSSIANHITELADNSSLASLFRESATTDFTFAYLIYSLQRVNICNEGSRIMRQLLSSVHQLLEGQDAY
ncbi:hypothetical protein L798_02546 [Zootermopsis nevadensis]|uniref:Uncharacterized protein n=1 Tax=Zootermopsis nevadensis TaxID=136037 RepID=A0A067RE73_ZOONE|nr:hypothetical protein L798_02546 [Zootermopsis nevadensis]